MSGTVHRFCEGCGAALPAGAHFCEGCGAKVEEAPAAIAIPKPAPHQQTQARAQRSRAPALLGIVGAVLLVTAAGAALWMRFAKAPVSQSGTTTSFPVPSAVPASAVASSPTPSTVASVTPVPGTSTPFVSEGTPPTATPTVTKPSPEVAAAQDLAEMVLWFEKQSWVIALRKSMPRGGTISMDAKPYDAEGWSDVELREQHAPDSGFDPDVSPKVGFFRVARAGRKIEWMEPVSGEYQPVEAFLKSRGIGTGANSAEPNESTASEPDVMKVIAGDFESKPPDIPNRDAAVIVPDPNNNKNHVARITGPDDMGFTLLAYVPMGTKELTVSLRLLHPQRSKLIRFDDGRMPEGIRLRVRLINELGNSAIRDAIVRPSGSWRDMEFTFYDLSEKVVQISVEAIWMQGSIYVDDVRIAP